MDLVIRDSADRERAKQLIDAIPEGEPFELTLFKHTEKRSLASNRLYWLILNCISDETDVSVNRLHRIFKEEFLGYKIVIKKGKEVEALISTTQLNVTQFFNYNERIRAFALSELRMYLPTQDDAYWNEFYNHYKNLL